MNNCITVSIEQHALKISDLEELFVQLENYCAYFFRLLDEGQIGLFWFIDYKYMHDDLNMDNQGITEVIATTLETILDYSRIRLQNLGYN